MYILQLEHSSTEITGNIGLDSFKRSEPRRLLRSSRPQEICQPPPRGFFCVRTCPVAASRKYFSAIHSSPHLNSHHT
jgi:hypothetical protein